MLSILSHDLYRSILVLKHQIVSHPPELVASLTPSDELKITLPQIPLRLLNDEGQLCRAIAYVLLLFIDLPYRHS